MLGVDKIEKKGGALFKDFKAFALKGNVVDLAVGIIIGGAFNGIVQSLVKDIIMPPIGLLLGNIDFSNIVITLRPVTAANPQAVTLNIGLFINTIVSFLIIAFSVFMLVKFMKKLEKKEELKPEAMKKCPYCFSSIDVNASRCAFCTSEIK
ncbi:MAG: large-conductance mechanosensitive channel protein MscL [Syntrophothermus sp.]